MKLPDWTKVGDFVLKPTLVFTVLHVDHQLLADGIVRIDLRAVGRDLLAARFDERNGEAHRLLVEQPVDDDPLEFLPVLVLALKDLDLVIPVGRAVALGRLDFNRLDDSRIPVGVHDDSTLEVVRSDTHLLAWIHRHCFFSDTQLQLVVS